MVRLRAFNRFEGAGVLETENGELKYIDFPYTPDHEYPCTVVDMERLILRMNFEGCDTEFPDSAKAILALRALANDGHNPFENEDEATILSRFNAIGIKNLEAIVEGIAKSIPEKRDYLGAIRALDRINSLPVVQENLDLRVKVLELRDLCRKERYEGLEGIKGRKPKSASGYLASPAWDTSGLCQKYGQVVFEMEYGNFSLAG